MIRWIGVLREIRLHGDKGQSLRLAAGEVLQLTEDAFQELKTRAGADVVELSPQEIAGVVVGLFSEEGFIASREQHSSILVLPCPDCRGIPAVEDAVTGCARCLGTGRIIRPVRLGPRPPGALGEPS